MDLPLYTTVSRSELSDLGSVNYHQFDHAITLDHVVRQAGQSDAQKLFRDILLRLRNGELSVGDWKHLMKQTSVAVEDPDAFDNAIRLFPSTAAVAEYNVAKLHANGQPVAVIKAVHSGPGASKVSSDDAGGLEAVVCIAHGARVMLTANLWVQAGLVNGATGTVVTICYDGAGEGPPNLPVAVTVRFDSYSGPTLHDGSVPIIPLRRIWLVSEKQCSRLQLPLKLAWAVTIHKCQGMTLDKAVVDVGKKEFSAGLTFVACSRVRELKDLLFVPPFPYQRVANLASSRRHGERLREEKRLQALYVKKISSKTVQPNQIPVTVPVMEAEAAANEADVATSSPHVPVTKAQGHAISTAEVAASPSADTKSVVADSQHTTTLAPKQSPNVPTAVNAQAQEDSELQIVRVDDNNDRFRYYPGDVEWQQRKCRELGLEYRGPNGVDPGSIDTLLTNPTGFKSIRGDGNCMFRAISLIITGSEDQHMQVRQAIVRHMRAIRSSTWESHVSTLLDSLHRVGEVTRDMDQSTRAESESSKIDQYIADTKMDCDTTWGSEVELMVLSNLLNTAVYTYSPTYKIWCKFIPSNVHGEFDVSTHVDSTMSVYMRHSVNHYDVVSSVR